MFGTLGTDGGQMHWVLVNTKSCGFSLLTSGVKLLMRVRSSLDGFVKWCGKLTAGVRRKR